MFEPSPTSGGVEHVTLRVAQGLKRFYGYHCFSLYKYATDDSPLNIFEDKQCLPQDNPCVFIRDFCIQNEIDIIVIQGRPEMIDVFRKSTDKARILYVHHSDPSFEIDTFNCDYLLYLIKFYNDGNKFSYIRQLLFYPLYKWVIKKRLRNKMNSIYNKSDGFGLISESAISTFKKITGINSSDKLFYINNPLSFEKFATLADISNKKKQVLVVCRMEEFSKKITKAIKIWNIITRDCRVADWNLTIIGDGVDLKYYKEIVEERKIPRICFKGSKAPYNDYMESSIFFMTSVSEAWGLTVTEAMQTGCAPIAFNSYAAIKDIIKDGENGVLVEPDNLKKFADMTIDLMLNIEMRQLIAVNAVSYSHRYCIESICREWKELFERINIG